MKALLLIAALATTPCGWAAAADEAGTVPSSLAFVEICQTAPTEQMGDTPYGHRQRVPILGGTFAGPGIKGRILPGGADTQLIRADGSLVIDANYVLETDDGVEIQVHNVGVLPPPHGSPHSKTAWAAPVFEAPMGRYGWLNSGLYVSSVTPNFDPASPAVTVRIYAIGDRTP